jgi:hypothetical protein
MNDVGKYLRLPVVADTLPTRQLPAVFVCPFRRDLELFQNADASLGEPYWITGYVYLARCDEQAGPGQVLKPERIASSKGKRRGVLWADTLDAMRVGGTLQGYAYFHFRGRMQFNPASGMVLSTTPLLGQHRAWSDGSVEWINGSNLRTSAGEIDQSASFKAVTPSAFELVFWF